MATLIEGANTHEVDAEEYASVGALADRHSILGRTLKVDGVPMSRSAALPKGCSVLEVIDADTDTSPEETKGAPPKNDASPHSETV